MEHKNPYGYIYKIEFPNGKVYIGLTTTSLKRRKSGHKKCAKGNDTRILYNALRKYRMEDTFELIEIDIAYTKEELCEKEIGYILIYKSFDKKYGYNMTYGGEGTNGYVLTEKQREKNSESKKKYYRETPGAKEKNSDTIKKYYRETSGAREKNSESKKKYYRETSGAREKQSEAIKKYYRETSGAREKQRQAQRKYHEDNPGAKEKQRQAQRKYYEENPELVKKILDTKGCNKLFDVFTIDGTFVKTFTYQMEAKKYLQREHKITGTIKVCEVLNGNRKSSLGFAFIYKDDPDGEKKILELKNKN